MFRVKVKNIKCENTDPTIYNGRPNCFIKPTRDGVGNTTISYIYGKPAYDVRAQIKVYYKYTGGMRPWMIDIDLDVCNNFLAENNTRLPTFVQLLVKSSMKNYPELVHPCPYKGDEGLHNANMDKMVSDLLPQIVPTGEYKIQFRLHLKDNRTYVDHFLTIFIDAKDPLKRINMG